MVTSDVALPTGVETGIRFVTPDAAADHADTLARGVDADDVLRWPGVLAGERNGAERVRSSASDGLDRRQGHG
jgi:hypothetical protein